MFCVKCGKKISDDSKFCPYCSYKVKRTDGLESKNIREAVPVKENISVQPIQSQQNNTINNNGNGKGSKKGLIIAAIAVGATLTVAALVVVFIILRGGFSKDELIITTTQPQTEWEAKNETQEETAGTEITESETAATESTAAEQATEVQTTIVPKQEPTASAAQQTKEEVSMQEDIPQNDYSDGYLRAIDINNLVEDKSVVVYIPGTQIVYTDQYLDTRGTVTYGSSDISYIESEDVRLLGADEGPEGIAAHIEYNTPGGRAQGYIPMSLISSAYGTITKYTSAGKFYVAVEDPWTLSSNHFVGKGDTVYYISDQGDGRYCIMYNLDAGGWRIAYCKSSDFTANAR